MGRAQVTRLIARYTADGVVQEGAYRRNRFGRIYTGAGIELPGTVDEAHESLSGPATQKILYREFFEYEDERYRRLAGISAPHIYNLRKAQPTVRGESPSKRRDRRKSRSASGGNQHWKASRDTCGSIAFIKDAMASDRGGGADQRPFRILGFHSDNGSEFINHTVAELLNKLLVEQTKSRPRHCKDNGLSKPRMER